MVLWHQGVRLQVSVDSDLCVLTALLTLHRESSIVASQLEAGLIRINRADVFKLADNWWFTVHRRGVSVFVSSYTTCRQSHNAFRVPRISTCIVISTAILWTVEALSHSTSPTFLNQKTASIGNVLIRCVVFCSIHHTPLRRCWQCSYPPSWHPRLFLFKVS